jgi:hypothetical protein
MPAYIVAIGEKVLTVYRIRLALFRLGASYTGHRERILGKYVSEVVH